MADYSSKEQQDKEKQYEDLNRDDLMRKAAEADIEGYAEMHKVELIEALKNLQ